MAKLEYNNYYHIYNRGINGTNLFLTPDNYKHFLELLSIYIDPIAEIFAWCLMKNHFHLLVRVNTENEIGYLNPLYAKEMDKSKKWKTYLPKTSAEKVQMEKWKKPNPTNQFGHLFDAYAKAFNKLNNRTGGLFEEPFERIHVDNEIYLKRLVIYINNNPVHHSFVKNAFDYSWSSYLSTVSIKPTKLSRNRVIGWFDSEANFRSLHEQKTDFDDIAKYIIDE